MFNFNADQLSTLFRSGLKIGGTIATVLAVVSPTWGLALQAIIGGIGTITTGVGLVMSNKNAKKGS